MQILLLQQSTQTTNMMVLDQMACGSWWKSNQLVFSWGSVMPLWQACMWKIQAVMIRIWIDNGVANRGSQNQGRNPSKTYFSCNKNCIQLLSFLLVTVKRMWERGVFSKFLQFWWRKQPKQKNEPQQPKTPFGLKTIWALSKQARNLLQL